MRYIVVILLLLSLLNADEFEHHSKRHIQKELSHLHLTKQQKKEVKVILKEFREELQEYREFKREIQKRKKKLFIKNSLNTKELSHLDALLHEEAKRVENRLLLQMHQILNRKQRKYFVKHFDDWEVE